MKYGDIFVEIIIGQMMMQVLYAENWDSLLMVHYFVTFFIFIIIKRYVYIYIYIDISTGAKGSLEYQNLTTFPFFLSGPNCSGLEEHLMDCPLNEAENTGSCSYTSVVHCTGS